MLKVILLIIAIILTLFLAVFSVCACILSSQCSRYEEYHRKSEDE